MFSDCRGQSVRPSICPRDAESLFFCGTPTLTPTPALKNLGLRLGLRAQNQTPSLTLGVTVWHTDCVLNDDSRQIVISSNRQRDRRFAVKDHRSFLFHLTVPWTNHIRAWFVVTLHARPVQASRRRSSSSIAVRHGPRWGERVGPALRHEPAL